MPLLLGPYGSGVPAIEEYKGRDIIQIFQGSTNYFDYSSQYSSPWDTQYLNVAEDSSITPPNSHHYAWKLTPTTDNQYHRLRRWNLTGYSGPHTEYIIARYAGYNYVKLAIGDAWCNYNLKDGYIDLNGGCDTKGMIHLGYGWWLCYLSNDCDFTALSWKVITVDCRAWGLAGGGEYPGDGSSGIHIWHAQLEHNTGWYPTLPIITNGSAGASNADQLYIPSANVPAEIRDDITFILVPYWASDTSENRMVIDFQDEDDSPRVYCYYSKNDNLFRVYDKTNEVTLVDSNELEFDMTQKTILSLSPSNGSIRVIGMNSGDGINYGTPWSTNKGNVWLGMSKNALMQYNGSIQGPFKSI